MNKRKRRKRRQSQKKKITVSNEYRQSEIEIGKLLDKTSTLDDKLLHRRNVLEKEIEFFTQIVIPTAEESPSPRRSGEVSSVKSPSTPLPPSETSKTHLASSYVQIEDESPVEVVKPVKIEFNDSLFYTPSRSPPKSETGYGQHVGDDWENLGLYVKKMEMRANRNRNRMANRFIQEECMENIGSDGFPRNQRKFAEDKTLYKTECRKKFTPIYCPATYQTRPQLVEEEDKKCIIHLQELKFTKHPLFTEEHNLAYKLEALYEIYTSKTQHNTISKIASELTTVREVVQVYIEREREEDTENLQKYVERAKHLRNLLHKEEKSTRDLVKDALATWKNLKDVRAKQGHSFTNHKVLIKTEEKDLETEERLWSERFETELNEVVREAFEAYFLEKRRRKLRRDDERVAAQPPLRKPNVEEIREDLKETFLRCVKDPSEPSLHIEMMKQLDVGGKTLEALKAKRYYLKLLFDGKPVVSTDPGKLSNNFVIHLNVAYSVYFGKRTPRDVKIEIYEKSRIPPDQKIASVQLPFWKMSNFSIKNLATLEFSSAKNDITGSIKLFIGSDDQENDMQQGKSTRQKFNLPKDLVKEWCENDFIDPRNPDCFSLCEIMRDDIQAGSSRENLAQDENIFILNEDLYAFCSANEINSDMRLKMLSSRFKSDMEVKDFRLVPAFDREFEGQDNERVIEENTWMDPIDLSRHKGKKFLNELYSTILNHCEQLNKSEESSNLLIGDQPPTWSSIFTSLMQLFGPRRPLNPPRKQTPTRISLRSQTFQNFNLIVNVVRATGVPVRSSSATMARRNSSVSLMHQAFKFANVRPYVSITYKDKVLRTVSVEGSNPTWNEQIILPLSGSISEFKGDVKFQLFDEYVEDLINDERSRTTEVYQRIYGKWLGELRIPISIIFSRQQVEGVFEMDSPYLLLGYTRPTLDPTEGAIAIENVPEIRDVVYLSVFVNIEPQFEMEKVKTTHLECSELKEVKTHVFEWSLQVKEMVPERFIDPLVTLANGKRVCVTRLLEPIPIPFEINDDTDKFLKRLVSLLPVFQSTNSCLGLTGVWLNNQLILDTAWASPKDLGVLLACFYLTLGVRVWLVLGVSYSKGETTFVLLKEAFNFVLVDPSNGKKYSCKDTLCPLTKVFCIVSQNNVYANIQSEARVSMTEFDVDDSGCWFPLFSKSNPAPIGGVHELDYVFRPLFSVTDLRKNIERKIMKKISSWRANRKTIWNRSLHDMLQTILRDLEQDVIFDQAPTIYIDRIQEATPAYKVSGFTLNFPYINLSSISDRIKATGIHLNLDKKVEFSLAVYTHQYPNNIISIWIFLLSLTPFL